MGRLSQATYPININKVLSTVTIRALSHGFKMSAKDRFSHLYSEYFVYSPFDVRSYHSPILRAQCPC